MAFLHGFRRVTYDYQPLVDSIMAVFGFEEGNNSTAERLPEEIEAMCNSLVELLEQESQSEFFSQGISCALYKMAEKGIVEAAEILLRYGADIHFEDPVSYYNPLHAAVFNKKPEMIKLLVAKGADIEKRDRVYESSPLDLASEEEDKLSCMLTLLDLGADVDAIDKNGKTSLLHAMFCVVGLIVHNSENIKLLLERGAERYAATYEGESADTSLLYMVDETMTTNDEDVIEMGKCSVKIAEVLFAHGGDPSYCFPEGDGLCVTQLCMKNFDLLFPMAKLIVHSGMPPHCTYHGESCYTIEGLIFKRLETALRRCTDPNHASDLLFHAEMLLDLARINTPKLNLPLRPLVSSSGRNAHPYAEALMDLHRRESDQNMTPPPLRFMCRTYLRRRLGPWPMDKKVDALPIPDKIKNFLLPERTVVPRPGWDHCKRKDADDTD